MLHAQGLHVPDPAPLHDPGAPPVAQGLKRQVAECPVGHNHELVGTRNVGRDRGHERTVEVLPKGLSPVERQDALGPRARQLVPVQPHQRGHRRAVAARPEPLCLPQQRRPRRSPGARRAGPQLLQRGGVLPAGPLKNGPRRQFPRPDRGAGHNQGHNGALRVGVGVQHRRLVRPEGGLQRVDRRDRARRVEGRVLKALGQQPGSALLVHAKRRRRTARPHPRRHERVKPPHFLRQKVPPVRAGRRL